VKAWGQIHRGDIFTEVYILDIFFLCLSLVVHKFLLVRTRGVAQALTALDISVPITFCDLGRNCKEANSANLTLVV